jgi:ADP-ribose pyrophosphatase YjhB (NUDIX family)
LSGLVLKDVSCKKGTEREEVVPRVKKSCPQCGHESSEYQNPVPTVDIIIEMENQAVVLIKRKNYPHGWALPGGFVDYGETVEHAAIREAREETSLQVEALRQFRVYSEPDRDPRQHTISVVFAARGKGTPRADDDAADLGVFSQENLPKPIVFDHEKILADYFATKKP